MTTAILDDPSRGAVHQLLVLEALLKKWNPKYDRDYLIEHFGFGVPAEDAATTQSQES